MKHSESVASYNLKMGYNLEQVLMVTVLAAIFCLPSLLAFSCGPCKLDECPDPGVCRGALTEDACGCCFQCARVENETCGGQYGLLGRCDEGLVCYITPKHGNPITGHEPGICKGKNNQVKTLIPTFNSLKYVWRKITVHHCYHVPIDLLGQ